MNAVACFDERLCKAQCCVLELCDEYVKAANKGRNTDQMFNNLMMVSAYMKSLERYKPHPEVVYERYVMFFRIHNISVDLPYTEGCIPIDPDLYNCLSVTQVEKIFDQVSILCGGCSCNCND